MDPKRLEQLLLRVQAGETSVGDAAAELAVLPFADLGYARVDHHRALRQGVPEVVLGQGKSVPQLVGICEELIRGGHAVLVTRLTAEAAAALVAAVPALTWLPEARVAVHRDPTPREPSPGFVAVVTAGTSDLPVAEEAAATLELCGVEVRRVVDVGVAGLHRLVAQLPALREATVVVVVAGMEGALPSVVGGLVAAPVVAVPTSIGYGVALSGMTALFGMLTSCASGITVVNVDNGFGAAMAAVRIVRTMQGRQERA